MNVLSLLLILKSYQLLSISAYVGQAARPIQKCSVHEVAGGRWWLRPIVICQQGLWLVAINVEIECPIWGRHDREFPPRDGASFGEYVVFGRLSDRH